MAEPWKEAIRKHLNSSTVGIRASDYSGLREAEVRKVILDLTQNLYHFNVTTPPHATENNGRIPEFAQHITKLYFAFRFLQLVKVKMVTPNVSNYIRKPHYLDNANTFQLFIATIKHVYAGEHPYAPEYILFKYDEFISIAKPFIKLFDQKFTPVRRLITQLNQHTKNIHAIFAEINTLITYYNTFLFPITSCLRYDTLQITGSCWINASLNALLLSNTLSGELRTIVDNSGAAANDVALACPNVNNHKDFRNHILSIIRAVLDHTLDPKKDVYKEIGIGIHEYKRVSDGGTTILAIYRIVNAVFPPEYYEFESTINNLYVSNPPFFIVQDIDFNIKINKITISPRPRAPNITIPSKPLLIVLYIDDSKAHRVPILRNNDTYRLESMVYAPTPGHVTTIFKCDNEYLEFDSNNDLKRVMIHKSKEFVLGVRFAIYLRQ